MSCSRSKPLRGFSRCFSTKPPRRPGSGRPPASSLLPPQPGRCSSLLSHFRLREHLLVGRDLAGSTPVWTFFVWAPHHVAPALKTEPLNVSVCLLSTLSSPRCSDPGSWNFVTMNLEPRAVPGAQKAFSMGLCFCLVWFSSHTGQRSRSWDYEMKNLRLGPALNKQMNRDFPGGPVVRTPHFHSQGLGLICGWGTETPQAAWCGQKNKIKINTINK